MITTAPLRGRSPEASSEVVIAIAAAAAPNPDKPPFYLDMPFATVDGGFEYVDEVLAAVHANTAKLDYEPVARFLAKHLVF
jgi:hypothetical protein